MTSKAKLRERIVELEQEVIELRETIDAKTSQNKRLFSQVQEFEQLSVGRRRQNVKLAGMIRSIQNIVANAELEK